ncbi:MAG: hypothetical protein A2061_06290 [Gallionellales bacterium GWA2_59_43]|nr:MAG: hypothetical protein A2061_06290 [Gallionellales bacterium GWA2_59_43]
MRRVATLLLLCTFAQPGLGADAGVLVETMKQARLSEGFEARMEAATVAANGRRATPFKLSVVGQIGAERQRLRIRGISPDKVRGRYVAAERNTDGHIRSIQYGEAASGSVEKSDPAARLFDSGLVLWDMFGAWWNWPQQSIEGSDRVDGRACTLVRSHTDDGASPVREVLSCVDRDAKLSLRTQLYDRRHALLRTIAVKQTIRKESGALAAKKLSITEADRTATEVEVYSGDEHYLVNADTFAALDSSK